MKKPFNCYTTQLCDNETIYILRWYSAMDISLILSTISTIISTIKSYNQIKMKYKTNNCYIPKNLEIPDTILECLFSDIRENQCQ